MKRLITLLIIVVFGLPLYAQDFIKVKGVVVNASGEPIAEATVTAVGTKVSVKTGSNGSFELMIPNTVRYVRVQKSMYLAQNVVVSPSLQIVLEVDKEAVEKAAEKARIAAERAKAEEEARVRAAAEAREKAIRDSLALVEQARLEAEARARAAAEAREKAIRDSLAMVEKARLEAEARARAAEEARQQAQLDSMARVLLIRDSIAAAEARAIFIRDSIAVAQEQQKKDAIKASNDQYNRRYKNQGIESTLEFGYAYQPATCIIRYQYSGYRSVSALHPVFVDYTLGYRINRVLSLGVGAGFMYNLKSVVIVNDQIWGTDKNWVEKRYDIPVFLDVKARFFRKSVRPIIDCKGGWYPITGLLFVDAGLGLEFRTSRQTALNVTASIRTTPYFEVDNVSSNSRDFYYFPCWSPSIRLGFAF